MSKNPYEILGLSKGASADDIKKAYHKKVMEFHPDRHANDTPEEQKKAEEKFKEINWANDLLGEPKRKEMYDMFGVTDQDDAQPRYQKTNPHFDSRIWGQFHPFYHDDFGGYDDDDFFSMFQNIHMNGGPDFTRETKYNIKISLKTALLGGSVEVKHNTRTFDVKIPPMTAPYTKMRMNIGNGEVLYLTIIVVFPDKLSPYQKDWIKENL